MQRTAWEACETRLIAPIQGRRWLELTVSRRPVAAEREAAQGWDRGLRGAITITPSILLLAPNVAKSLHDLSALRGVGLHRLRATLA
jgi:hypothetical protein